MLLFDPHLDGAGIRAGGLTLEHFTDGRAFELIRSTAPVREAGAVRCMGSLQGLWVLLRLWVLCSWVDLRRMFKHRRWMWCVPVVESSCDIEQLQYSTFTGQGLFCSSICM